VSRFTATVSSAADIGADREAVWKALTDPDLLSRRPFSRKAPERAVG
jgi:uncharacterized protein YndB with AHSA1/START domain